MTTPRFLVLTAAFAAFLLATPDSAFARRGGREGSRARARIALTESPSAPFSAREARLRIERKDASRTELRVQIEGAPTGLDLRVFVADNVGTLVQVATMDEDDAGEYVWRVRTKKGDALPFGQSDVSGLSGRALEVRTGAGQVAFTTTFPTIAAPVTRKAPKAGLRTAFAVDGTNAAALGADLLKAKVEVRSRRGEEKLKIEVEGVPAGLGIEIWMEDPTTGAMTLLTTFSPTPGTTAPGKRGGDDDDTDDDSDDDSDDDDSDDGDGDEDEGDEFEYEVDTGDGDTLPFGVTSVSALAGLDVEIRASSGEVLATGEVPAVGEDARGDDDDDDGKEDGSEDEDEDEDEDDDQNDD